MSPILQLERSQSSRIEESIDQISDIVETQVIKKSENQDKEFYTIFLELVLCIINLVEEWFQCTDGSTKKLIVIEIGEKIIEKYFEEYLPYYQENIDTIIDKTVESYKIFMSLNLVKNKCCIPFCA